MAKLDVTFESDIPKIVREGSERKSKYDTLLDQIKDRASTLKGKNKVAKLVFDSQSQATSRYTSVRDAVAKRDDKDEWKVAVRRNPEVDNEFGLYIKWDPALAEETQDEEATEDDADF